MINEKIQCTVHCACETFPRYRRFRQGSGATLQRCYLSLSSLSATKGTMTLQDLHSQTNSIIEAQHCQPSNFKKITQNARERLCWCFASSTATGSEQSSCWASSCWAVEWISKAVLKVTDWLA